MEKRKHTQQKARGKRKNAAREPNKITSVPSSTPKVHAFTTCFLLVGGWLSSSRSSDDTSQHSTTRKTERKCMPNGCTSYKSCLELTATSQQPPLLSAKTEGKNNILYRNRPKKRRNAVFQQGEEERKEQKPKQHAAKKALLNH